MLKWILRILFAVPLYIDYTREERNDNKPKIFVANHLSTLDPLMLMIILPEQVAILITGGIFSLPIIGKFLTKAGHIPVYDNQRRSVYDITKRQLLKGRSVLIFPEGQLSHENGSIKALYSGAVRLAMETNAPIVPIGISMSKNRWIKKRMYVGDKIEYARFYLLGTYAITVGTSIQFAGSIEDHLQKTEHKVSLIKLLQALAAKSAARIKKNAILAVN